MEEELFMDKLTNAQQPEKNNKDTSLTLAKETEKTIHNDFTVRSIGSGSDFSIFEPAQPKGPQNSKIIS